MRNDSLDALTYLYYRPEKTKPLGTVTATEYTDDDNHSSACVYINLNPEGRTWIDELKKSIESNERRQRMRFNSHYGMHVEEVPEHSYINHFLYNKQEEKKMSKDENEYIAKKNLLKVDQAEKENELKMKYDTDLIELRREYGEKFEELEKEKEDAENKEKADAHAKAVKAAYDAYIAQGFTKTQAESFIKIALEN